MAGNPTSNNYRRQKTRQYERCHPDRELSIKAPPRQETDDEDRLKVLAAKTDILGLVDKQRRNAALAHFRKKSCTEGEIICRQGNYEDFFYMIDSGKFAYYDEGNPRREEAHWEMIESCKNHFGELALLFKDERDYTVKCEKAGILWCIDGRIYRRIITRMAYERRERQRKLMRNLDLLKLLEPYECNRLCDIMEYRKYSQGKEVYSVGDPARGVYFIHKGEALLVKEGQEPRTLREGDYFGEMALLTKDVRDHSVKVTCRKLECYFMLSESYESLMSSLYRLLKKRKPEEWKKLALKYFGSENPTNVVFRLALSKKKGKRPPAKKERPQVASGN